MLHKIKTRIFPSSMTTKPTKVQRALGEGPMDSHKDGAKIMRAELEIKAGGFENTPLGRE